jgi:hypothetical protein
MCASLLMQSLDALKQSSASMEQRLEAVQAEATANHVRAESLQESR